MSDKQGTSVQGKRILLVSKCLMLRIGRACRFAVTYFKASFTFLFFRRIFSSSSNFFFFEKNSIFRFFLDFSGFLDFFFHFWFFGGFMVFLDFFLDFFLIFWIFFVSIF